MDKLKKILVGIIILAIGIGAGIGIFAINAPEPQVVYKTEYVTEYVPEYIYLTRTEYVYRDLRQFNSVSELKGWLAKDNTDSMQYVTTTFDCEDFAMMLQKHAAEDGYILSMQLVDTDGNGLIDHAINTAVVGNIIYAIEPQTDYVWFYCYCD
jgi:hypothetical protein